MASPVRLLHRVQVVLALLHLEILVIQEVSVNTKIPWFLFPHWFTRRTLGASLCLGTFSTLAKKMQRVSLCLLAVLQTRGFRVLTESGDRSPRANSLILSLQIVAGHVVEFHIVLRQRCWKAGVVELEEPVDKTPDYEWRVILRITPIFAVLDEVSIKPVASLIRIFTE